MHGPRRPMLSRLRPAWAACRVWALPVVVLIAACLPTLFGGRWGVDTGWYAGIALDAVREGHWWDLHAGDRPYFNKPPLAFWVHGIFMAALGTELWVIRLPGLLAAAACVVLTVSIARRLEGWRVGLLSGLVLATTIEFFRLTDRFRLDYLLLLLLLAGVRLVVEGSGRERGGVWVLAAGLPIGLALLSKPLLALAAVPILAAWLVFIGRPRLAPWLVPCGLLALAVAAPWHLSMAAAYGGRFIDEYFVRQSLERGRSDLFGAEPWWWYLAFLGRNYWPWVAAVGLAGWIWLSGRGKRERSATILLAALWTVAWLVALSVFADKKKQYLFPIYPSLAWIAALGIAGAWPRALSALRGRWLDLAAAVALGASLLATVFVIPHTRTPMAPEWEELYTFLRSERPAELWNGGLYYTDAGMVYVKTGLWPRETDLPGDRRRDPPRGALVLYDTEQGEPPGGGREVFRSGKLVVVVAGADGGAADDPR